MIHDGPLPWIRWRHTDISIWQGQWASAQGFYPPFGLRGNILHQLFFNSKLLVQSQLLSVCTWVTGENRER